MDASLVQRVSFSDLRIIVKRHLSWYEIPEYSFIVKTVTELFSDRDQLSKDDIVAKIARLLIKNITMIPYFLPIIYQKTK